MSEKIMSIGTIAAEGVTVPVKLQSRLAQDAIDAPGDTKGTDKGDTPYRQAILNVSRVSADPSSPAGTVAVYTARRPNPRMAGVGALAQYAQAILCDGTNHQYDTKFDYAAFDANNWIVELNGVVLTHAAAPADLTEWLAVDNGGTLQVQIGDGDPLPDGEISVISVAGTGIKDTLLADGLQTGGVRKIVNPGDYVWLQAVEVEQECDSTSASLEFFYR